MKKWIGVVLFLLATLTAGADPATVSKARLGAENITALRRYPAQVFVATYLPPGFKLVHAGGSKAKYEVVYKAGKDVLVIEGDNQSAEVEFQTPAPPSPKGMKRIRVEHAQLGVGLIEITGPVSEGRLSTKTGRVVVTEKGTLKSAEFIKIMKSLRAL